MYKSKWYVSLSIAALLVGAQLPNVVAEQAIEMENVIEDSVKVHQVKENDKIEDIAKELEMDSELLKMIQSGSKYKLSKQGNWAILYKKQFLILADEHIHDYAVYDITLENKEKKQSFTKIEVTDEIKAILEVLHEKYGHLDGSHDHEGHDHSHGDHDHSHAGHDHSHGDHDHSHAGHDHSHGDHDHSHGGDDHSHAGHAHSHGDHDHNHAGHDHSHEGHAHSHGDHDHNHAGHDHSHEGHAHSHEDYDHNHAGHDHSHEGHDHSHEGHDHNHAGHDHEGHYDDISKVDPKDIVSEDDLGYVIKHGNHFHFIPKKQQPKDSNTTENNKEDSTSSEEQVMLDLKKTYIAAIFNVPKESVKVSNNFLVFSMPGEDYDPTHIHPFSVPIDRIIVPEVTGDAETDFENELRSMSYLVGIPVRNLKIKDNKFVMDHGSHYHYLNVIAVDGIKPFYDNQLPDIKGSYVAGDLDVEVVKAKVHSVLDNAKVKFANDSKQLRRIEYALEAFSYKLDDLKTNSTVGYLDMLNQFESDYVNKEKEDSKVNDATSTLPKTDASKENETSMETDMTKENDASKENTTMPETDTPKESMTETLDAETKEKRDALIETIRGMNLKGYSVTREDLVNQLQALATKKQVDDYVKFVDEIKHARPETIFAMKYLDYVMVNLESPVIDNSLREELSDLARLTFEAQMGGKVKSEALIVRLIEARKHIEDAKAANVTNEKRENGEKYKALTEELRGKPRYAHIVEFVKGVRSLLETYTNPYLPNVAEDIIVPDFNMEEVKPNTDNEAENKVDSKDEVSATSASDTVANDTAVEDSTDNSVEAEETSEEVEASTIVNENDSATDSPN